MSFLVSRLSLQLIKLIADVIHLSFTYLYIIAADREERPKERSQKEMIPCSCFLSSSWLQLVNLLSITMLVVVTIMGNNDVTGFSPSLLSSPFSINTLHNSRRLSISRIPSSALLTSFQCHNRLGARVSNYDDDNEDEEEKDLEFARVRRNRGRRTYDDVDDDMYEDEEESRSRRKSSSVMDAADVLEGEGFFDGFDDDEYDDEDEDDESYDMFSNTLIPNPILDSIDPDGSAERFPELASDPRFWFDMFIFIAFLNFISFIGPRNPFIEIIPSMYTAGLPPPGI